jgi:hypothetical protein
LWWSKAEPCTAQDWLVMLASSAAGSVGGLAAGTIVSTIFILFSSKESNGVLGPHECQILAEGFAERTSANEGISKWAGIQSIRVVGPYVCIQISSFLFHIVPRRSFQDDAEFREFHERLIGAWKGAA